ncbi:MAG: alanine dehydrogenase [Anaerolineales bacterium]|nr:alanine dehydrogenase [Anaerolineales bacterium]
MNIGVPRERQPGEYRVGIPPAGVRLLSQKGHAVFVERDAGAGAGFDDDDFRDAGATIVYSGEESYGRADLILKIARPTAEEAEWVRPGSTIFGYLHLNAASPREVDPLIDKGVTALGYERVLDEQGGAPLLRPLSQIGGRMAAQVAARLLQNDSGNRGVLLGGVPGVPPAEVVIIGVGVVGENAAWAFAGSGAQLTLLDRNLDRLQDVERSLPTRPVTMLANGHTIASAISYADVVVGAVRVRGGRAPVVLNRDMLSSMKRGALLLDLSIDEGGCAETSRPTSHNDPTYIEEGVMHCCIPNLPGAVARTATHAFQSAAWPFILRVVEHGLEAELEANPGAANALMLDKGEPTNYQPVQYG